MLLLLVSILNYSAFCQKLAVEWNPMQKKNLDWDYYKVIGAVGDFYYRYEEIWDLKFTKTSFKQNIVKYNVKHEKIATITFESGLLNDREAKRIRNFIFTKDRIVLYNIDYFGKKKDSILHEFKSVNFDLSEQTKWVTIERTLDKYDTYFKVKYNDKINKIFYMHNFEFVDKVSTKLKYVLLNPISLGIEGANEIVLNYPQTDRDELEVFDIDEDEIIIKFKNYSDYVNNSTENGHYHYMLRHKLLTDNLEKITFNTDINSSINQDFKYNPITQTFFLFTIIEEGKGKNVKFIAGVEKYDVKNKKLEILASTVIPVELYNNFYDVKYYFRYSMDTKGYYLSINIFNLELLVDNSFENKRNSAAGETVTATGLINQKAIGIVKFDEQNQVLWSNLIIWKSSILSKKYSDYLSLIVDDKFSVFFYDNLKNYELNGNYKMTLGNDPKKMNNGSDKVLTQVTFNNKGEFTRKFANTDGKFTFSDDNNKIPFIDLYGIRGIEDLVKFGEHYIVEYSFKKNYTVGILKISQ